MKWCTTPSQPRDNNLRGHRSHPFLQSLVTLFAIFLNIILTANNYFLFAITNFFLLQQLLDLIVATLEYQVILTLTCMEQILGWTTFFLEYKVVHIGKLETWFHYVGNIIFIFLNNMLNDFNMRFTWNEPNNHFNPKNGFWCKNVLFWHFDMTWIFGQG